MGQAEAARLLDMIENDEAAERPARDVGIIEGIDQRQAVGEAVGQADREQMDPYPAGRRFRSATRYSVSTVSICVSSTIMAKSSDDMSAMPPSGCRASR